VVLIGLGCALLWSYWPILVEISEKWASDPQYSHGFLVPIFAAVLLWLRRAQLTALAPSYWGLPFLVVGLGLRLVGAFFFFEWFEAISLLFLLAGSALLLGGWPALRWSWLSIAFLVFMMPLPYRVETGLSQPLQRLATVASTYTLQTLGRPAVSEGNIIIVNQKRLGVVEACNGLGMLLLFFAMSCGMAVLSRRGLLEKTIIVLSAVPIAVLTNVLRITTAGILHEGVGEHWADLVFHDWLAGPFMMGTALGLLWLEWILLAHLFVEVPVRTLSFAPADSSRGLAAGQPRVRELKPQLP
jgi:exosortase